MALRFLVTPLVCALWLAGSACASAPSTPAGPGPDLRGVISAVERDGTLVVKPPEGPPRGYNANPRTAKVERDGKPATFADLKIGDAVSVRVVGDVLEVAATSPPAAPAPGKP